MSSPRAYYSKTPNIRIRPVNEMDVCLVYTPNSPKLYTLNPTAWLVMELCDGRDLAALERRYYAAIEPSRSREAAKTELGQTLDDLIRMGVVEITAGNRFRKQARARRRES